MTEKITNETLKSLLEKEKYFPIMDYVFTRQVKDEIIKKGLVFYEYGSTINLTEKGKELIKSIKIEGAKQIAGKTILSANGGGEDTIDRWERNGAYSDKPNPKNRPHPFPSIN